MEFHASNPLFSYLIFVTCLRGWRKFSEINDLEKDDSLNELTFTKEISFKHKKSEKFDNITNNQDLNSPVIPISMENNMEFYMNSYLVVPNYILENQ